MKYYCNVKFPELRFTSPGIYTYIIKETTPSDDKWTTDNRIYRVVVTITDNGDGTLAAKTDYLDGIPKFINTYKRNCCKCCLSFCKHLKCILLYLLACTDTRFDD